MKDLASSSQPRVFARQWNVTFFGDHRDGVGDIQKDEAEDSEEVDDELEELPEVEGNENLAMEDEEGVASSLGDFS